MSTMPELWDRSPKAHLSVISDIKTRMLSTWTFEQIYLEVVKSGIEDDDDKLATTRALVLIRNEYARALQSE